jgi:tetratricopeptide (TPR) repeat protein
MASPTILFRDSAGRELTLEALQAATVTGAVRWEIRMGAAVPLAARMLHDRGRAHGSRAEYDTALSLFAEAAALAPEWPYPVYDAAFTYLRKHDWATARQWFERTLVMSPRGFFTAITAADSLRREAIGEFPAGTYLFYTHIEFRDSKEEQSVIALLLKSI